MCRIFLAPLPAAIPCTKSPFLRAKPREVFQFLMDQHGLLQKDLADVFGTPSIVSEVLSGKRDLNKDHIKRLSRRFHVSPELFF